MIHYATAAAHSTFFIIAIILVANKLLKTSFDPLICDDVRWLWSFLDRIHLSFIKQYYCEINSIESKKRNGANI